MQNQGLTKNQLKASTFLNEQLQYLETKHRLRFEKRRTSCPFHSEANPSMSKYIDKDGVVRFHCFGCGINEDIFGIMGRLEKHASFNVCFSTFRRFVEEKRKWGTNAKP